MKSENKSKKGFWVVIIAIVAVFALVVIASTANTTPKAIFYKQIDELLAYEEAQNHKSMKMNMELSMDIEGGEETKEMANLLKDAKMFFNWEIDNEAKEELYGIQLTKGNDEIINVNAKVDSASEIAYVNLGKIFDKTIAMDVSEMFEDRMTESLTLLQLLNAKKAEAILKKEIKNQLKTEYFISEKTTMYGQKVTKNGLKMSEYELKDAIQNVCQNLLGNEEFMDCFEDDAEVENVLQDIIDEMHDSDVSDDTYFEVDLYTKGILPEIVSVDFVITEDNEEIRIQMTQVSSEEYAYEIIKNNEKAIEGTVKIQDNGEQAKVEVIATEKGTTVKATASSNVVYDEELSEFDSNNVVNAEELTMEDSIVIYGNFLQSNLYDLIEQFSGKESFLSENIEGIE